MERIIWICGASSGIGYELAKLLIRNDYKVAVSARRKDLLEEKFSEDKDCLIFPCDISDLSEVIRTFEIIKENYFIETLINCAGVFNPVSIQQSGIEDIVKTLEINYLGSVFTIKSVLEDMIAKKEGNIINILSVVTDKIYKNSASYTASKMALLGFTNVLREEVREHNIKIINVFPGAVSTDIWNSKIVEKYGNRMLSPVEVAEQIFLLFGKNGNLVTEELKLRSIYGDL